LGGVRVTRLENGLRVVTETVADVSSAAVGVWVENGSRFESHRHSGISHFIEHLLFKGTERRSAREIAEAIEGRGGSINAFTGKEYTCYHARILGEHLDTALDVLADIFLNSTFRNEDIDLERDVVCQEILDGEDCPEDVVHDYFLASYWPGHPLGWPVLGTKHSLANIGRGEILDFINRRYTAERVIVAVAGCVEHERVVDLCRGFFAGMKNRLDEAPLDRPDFNPGVFVRDRELEQVHILLGMPGVSYLDPRYEVAEVLIAALGGGMSSRLFQSIREEKGKAYSVYAFQGPFRDIGYTGIYAATGHESVAEVIDLALAETAAVASEGLKPEELERTKEQLIGSIPLALESTDSRMFRLARNQMYFGREVPVEDVVAKLRKVSNDDIVALATEVFAFDRLGVALLGDAEEHMVSLPLS